MTTDPTHEALTDAEIEWLRANLVATVSKDTQHSPILTIVPHIEAICDQAKEANALRAENLGLRADLGVAILVGPAKRYAPCDTHNGCEMYEDAEGFWIAHDDYHELRTLCAARGVRIKELEAQLTAIYEESEAAAKEAHKWR